MHHNRIVDAKIEPVADQAATAPSATSLVAGSSPSNLFEMECFLGLEEACAVEVELALATAGIKFDLKANDEISQIIIQSLPLSRAV